MASISLYRCSDKVPGPVRFRLSDGRGICLYWTGFSRNRDEAEIETCKKQISEAYESMRKEGMPLTSLVLREVVDKRVAESRKSESRKPESRKATTPKVSSRKAATSKTDVPPLVGRYRTFISQAYSGGFIGTARYKQCCAIARRMERWLRMTHREGLAVEGFNSTMLLEYRNFLFDEYRYVGKCPEYCCNGVRFPVKRRKNSSVVLELKALKAFFTELEDLEEIRRSPFRQLPKDKRKSIMHVMYDMPVFLRKSEFQTVCKAKVPETLEWVRDVFVFNCCVGCRIGDVQRLGPDKLETSEEGIPFIHYIPQKTKFRQNTNCEIETPLVPMAYRIVSKGWNKFSRIIYNKLLKELLRYCGISRKVRVFNELEGDNKYIPLHLVATSKLARKTHVDLMNKVQLDPWASGLHKLGSNAVFRYTCLELSDRYRLMLRAFGNSL